MLRILHKMALHPDSLATEDIEAARAAGVSDEAIYEAAHVGYLFAIYNRLADTLGWDIPGEASFEKQAERLLTRGYQ